MNNYKVLVRYEAYTTVSLTAVSDKEACMQAEECAQNPLEYVTSSKILSKEKIIEPVTGKEASDLALLAMYPKMHSKDMDVILKSLKGNALEAAYHLTGLNNGKKPEKHIAEFVKGLQKWAAEIDPIDKKIIK